jgi:type IV pilus assembly protein PilX
MNTLTPCHGPGPARERGIILLVGLILLLILTLLGVALARSQVSEEQMARNEHNHALALETAEATLRAAEADLAAGVFQPSAFALNSGGTYTLASEPSMTGPTPSSVVNNINWASPGGATIPYDGPPLAGAGGTPMPASAQTPQYVIEQLPDVCCPGSNCGSNSHLRVYRITAYAVGPDGNATSMVQSTYSGC